MDLRIPPVINKALRLTMHCVKISIETILLFLTWRLSTKQAEVNEAKTFIFQCFLKHQTNNEQMHSKIVIINDMHLLQIISMHIFRKIMFFF